MSELSTCWWRWRLHQSVNCHHYAVGELSPLCSRWTVTVMQSVNCHRYAVGELSPLCSRWTVTVMQSVSCHRYAVCSVTVMLIYWLFRIKCQHHNMPTEMVASHCVVGELSPLCSRWAVTVMQSVSRHRYAVGELSPLCSYIGFSESSVKMVTHIMATWCCSQSMVFGNGVQY